MVFVNDIKKNIIIEALKDYKEEKEKQLESKEVDTELNNLVWRLEKDAAEDLILWLEEDENVEIGFRYKKEDDWEDINTFYKYGDILGLTQKIYHNVKDARLKYNYLWLLRRLSCMTSYREKNFDDMSEGIIKHLVEKYLEDESAVDYFMNRVHNELEEH